MKDGPQSHMRLTKNLPKPTYYAAALDGEFADHAFNEERAIKYKGLWREKAFSSEIYKALDLEIGTGNGFYFTHHALVHPDRLLLGIELKYKPLIQSIRRALRAGCTNARIARYNANFIWELFQDQELDNVYIHFPDPWIKKSKKKNRLINTQFLQGLFSKQKPGGFIEFKTDSLDYFNWAMDFFEDSPYEVRHITRDLHNSEFSAQNFETHFEKIFLKQNIKINYTKVFKA